MKKGLQYLVFALIGVLICEGIIRKVLPGGLSTVFILVKDGLAFLIMLLVLQNPPKGRAGLVLAAWAGLAVVMLPMILFTAIKDPILAVFGAKQYLLFPAVALGMVAAFGQTSPLEATRPYRYMAWALYPIVALSLLQLALPPSHWLNLSVAGEDLSAFSAGGRLRVSGPFPFVAQYSWFLHVAIYAIALTLMVRPALEKPWSWLSHPLPLLFLLMIANFISGSRLSAIGSALIVVVGICFVLLRGKGKSLREIVVICAMAGLALLAARMVAPAAFEAFDVRSGDLLEGEVGEEYMDRMNHAFFGWIYLYEHYQPGFFGYGLGVMSNGVQNISAHAAQVRSQVWGEADLANTVLEGGYYLVAIWMSFRLFIIAVCIRAFFSLQHSRVVLAGALALGSVIFNGLFSTLGIQPPLAIWWFLSVGTLLLLENLEPYWRAVAAEKKKAGETAEPQRDTLSGTSV
ncbi:MAG: hypothetical protein Q7P63_05610 [Verrucomicrobiota bacterium JB022]|nr:hypothetical protein [Verrucomicrobiota bacterium JB022]